jgi:hypothetical protein
VHEISEQFAIERQLEIITQDQNTKCEGLINSQRVLTALLHLPLIVLQSIQNDMIIGFGKPEKNKIICESNSHLSRRTGIKSRIEMQRNIVPVITLNQSSTTQINIEAFVV